MEATLLQFSRTCLLSFLKHSRSILLQRHSNYFVSSIAEVMETSDAAAEEATQSEEEPEIVTEEDQNRKIIAEKH